MDLSGDSDEQLRGRLTQVQKEIVDARDRLANREGERTAISRELEARDEAKRIAALPPVDRSARVLTSGEREVDRPDYREIDSSTGMQKSYVVLNAEERAKGFVRPVRRTYTHKPCGTTTTMGVSLAETYARDPKFYSGTFCVSCRAHFDLDQFVWKGTDEQVGS
jgi:hypothetical protein